MTKLAQLSKSETKENPENKKFVDEGQKPTLEKKKRDHLKIRTSSSQLGRTPSPTFSSRHETPSPTLTPSLIRTPSPFRTSSGRTSGDDNSIPRKIPQEYPNSARMPKPINLFQHRSRYNLRERLPREDIKGSSAHGKLRRGIEVLGHHEVPKIMLQRRGTDKAEPSTNSTNNTVRTEEEEGKLDQSLEEGECTPPSSKRKTSSSIQNAPKARRYVSRCSMTTNAPLSPRNLYTITSLLEPTTLPLTDDSEEDMDIFNNEPDVETLLVNSSNRI